MRLETAVDPRLDEIIDRFFADRITRADDMGGRYGDLWRRAADATQGGKRLRPRLLLLAHESLGGVEEDSALRAAAGAGRLPCASMTTADTTRPERTAPAITCRCFIYAFRAMARRAAAPVG